MTTGLATLATALLAVLAGVAALIGAVGLVRLPGPLARLHAGSVVTALGSGGAALASMVHFGSVSAGALVLLFVALSAPVSANLIAKAHRHRCRHGLEPADMPPAAPPPGSRWAGDDAPGSGPSPGA